MAPYNEEASSLYFTYPLTAISNPYESLRTDVYNLNTKLLNIKL